MTPPDPHWYPFTQARDSQAFPPLTIHRARGPWLWDDRGRRYFDTISSWWTNIHGHGHPALVRAMHRQAKKLDHVNFSGFTHKPAGDLTSRLKERLPEPLCRFFFSDNGSTAVEAALKMAFQYFHNRGRKEKNTFAYFDLAYHGDTLGAVAVSGTDGFHQTFQPLRFPCVRLPHPPQIRSGSITGDPTGLPLPQDYWEDLEKRIRQEGTKLAAVILEPLIFCVGGMRPYPAELLRRLESLCRSLDILLIYDEVATGFGRTGSFFALDRAGTVPDFLCLAKGLSGGVLPLALTVTTEKIYQAFAGGPEKTFYHGHSYTANPIACAAGSASLDLFRKHPVLEKSQAAGEVFRQILGSWAGLDWVQDIRFLGLLGAVDPLGGDKDDLTRRIYRRSLEAGLVLRPLGASVYWFLPLITTPKQVRWVLEKSRQVIEAELRASSPLFPGAPLGRPGV